MYFLVIFCNVFAFMSILAKKIMFYYFVNFYEIFVSNYFASSCKESSGYNFPIVVSI